MALQKYDTFHNNRATMTLSHLSVEARLKLAITEKMRAFAPKQAKSAFRELSLAYRKHEAFKISGPNSDELFLSYLATRMPATFAVVKRVMTEYLSLTSDSPKSLLDIGAGPGTASFACLELFEHLEKITLIEKEPTFQRLAKNLARDAQIRQMAEATWNIENAGQIKELPKVDLVVASYSLSEMPLQTAKDIAARAFSASTFGFVIIEPGTPQGFSLVREIRTHLLNLGAYVAAPCPHREACPMVSPDFCHFSERLIREKYHREAKNASLPYEDEKFSYAIFSKKPSSLYSGRLVKRPIKGSGHVTLDICTEGKIVRQVVARSNKSLYKQARKAEWGDQFGPKSAAC